MAEKDVTAGAGVEGGQDATPPVVGIGASAGGLDALKAFLEHVPAGSGLAFVLVQHLDPGRQSMLVELLGRVTAMTVCQATDGAPLKGDCVYVIPPKADLTVSGGRLIVREAPGGSRLRCPIDLFFRSLAADQGRRGICVIMSGTGSDGSQGLREVKKAGGMVIAQSPESAGFDGMPRSAVNTGLVDFILPPERMPRTILSYVGHDYVRGVPAVRDERDVADDIRTILSLVHAGTGHNFTRYKKSTLIRRLERRMGLNQVPGLREYIELLRSDDDEVRRLLKDLLIGVTDFFRESEAWRLLRTECLPGLIKRLGPDEPLRVWTPGCATGEEAYTMAMVLAESFAELKQHPAIQIFATDIDEEALELARKGRFSEAAMANVPQDCRERWFQFEGGQYQASSVLRDAIVFSSQNLINDPPFSRLHMISCRNLMIYLERELQEKILQMFHFSLLNDGILMLGKSETIGRQTDLFRPVSMRERIYRRKNAHGRLRPDIPMMRHLMASLPRSLNRPVDLSVQNDAGTLLRDALLGELAPAAVLIDKDYRIRFHHGETGLFLRAPEGEPTSDLFSLLRQGLVMRVRGAIHRAVAEGRTVDGSGVRIKRDDAFVPVAFKVIPVRDESEDGPLATLCFWEDREAVAVERAAAGGVETEGEDVIQQLSHELQQTREQLHRSLEETEGSYEELKASSEEMMSMNEELQASNEELETSKEELQSLNEELSTVNAELQEKVTDVEEANNDLENFISSSDIATIFLDTDLRIRRFTPAIQRIFSLTRNDIGRFLGDFSPRLNDPDLLDEARAVLADLAARRREAPSEDGQWYDRRVLPYRTQDDRIEGVVITFNDVTAARRVREELDEHRRNLEQLVAQRTREVRSLTDNALDLIYRLDRAHRHIFVNKRILEVTGIPEERYLGATNRDLGMPEDLCRMWERQVEQCFETAEPVALQFEFPGPEGLTIFESRVAPEFDDNGEVVTVMGIARDVTAREQAVRELDLAGKTLREALDAVSDGIWELDLPGGKALLNDHSLAMFGFDPAVEDPDAETIFARVHPEDLPLVRQAIDGAAAGKTEFYQREFRVCLPDGSVRWILGRGRVIERDAEGRPLRMIGTNTDVTERRRAEESYTRICRLATELICVADFNNARFLRVNPAFEQTLGYTEAELVSRSFMDFVHPDDARATRDIMANKLLQGENVISFENRYRCKDGVYRWLSWNSHPIVEEGICYAIAHDVTEQKIEEAERARLQAQLAQAQKMESIGRLAGGVAHDFNNMLQTILGYCGMVLAEIDESHPFHEHLSEIRRAATHSADLTRQLLAFARKQTIAPVLLDLNETVGGMLKMLRRLIGEDLELTWEPLDRSLPVRMDPAQVDQILANLVVNARDAISGVGRITIETGCEQVDERYTAVNAEATPGRYAVLAVSDTGAGMDAETLAQVFEPFFTTKPLDKGTGLGLATVYGIVRQNGGFLNVYSEPGTGTTFKIYLPAERGDCAAEAAKHHDIPNPNGSETVLLVEDDAAILKLGGHLLRKLGYTVLTANAPEEAIELARRHADEIHLLLTDVVMPRMSGRDLLMSLIRIIPNLKCLFMSGYTANVIANRGLLDEGVHFIQKPFAADDLAIKLREVLESH